MSELNIVVLGNPQAQKRHRSFRTGKGIRSYDPSKDDKSNFIAQLIAQIPRDFKPIAGMIQVYITYTLKRPKNHYRTGKNAGMLKDSAPYYHTKKPDLDNLNKLVLDAGSGILWVDDSLICCLSSRKHYGETPKTEIRIIY